MYVNTDSRYKKQMNYNKKVEMLLHITQHKLMHDV